MPAPPTSRLDLRRVAGILAVIVLITGTGAVVLAGLADSGPPSPDPDAAGSTATGVGPPRSYFVSPDGDDAGDGSSPDRPLRTIQRALDAAAPGSVVQLAPGSYLQDIQTRRDGLPGSPITISGPPEAVVRGGGAGHVVEVDHNHHVLSGFVVDGLFGERDSPDGYRSKLLWIQGRERNGVSGVSVENMVIRNALGECVRLRYFAVANEIAHSTIANCGLEDYEFGGDGKNGEGIYIGTAPEQRDNGVNLTDDVDRSSRNWIHDNHIDTQANECVDIKEGAVGNIVEGNSCTGQRDPDSGGFDARGSGNVFRLNDIFGNLGPGIRLGGDRPNDGTHNDVHDNTIRDNEGGGVKFVRVPQGKICGNTMSGNSRDAVGDFADRFVPGAACG